MKANTITLFSAAPMANTDVLTSNPIVLDQIYGFAVQAVWTGTPNGAFKIQATSEAPPFNDQVSVGVPQGTFDWTDIPDSAFNVTGSAGNYMWNVNGAFYRYMRLVYTNSSSTGTLNAVVMVKGV